MDFLKQYLAAICAELQKEGVSRRTCFHISDEPSLEAIDSYRSAAEIIRPLIGDCRTLDALSDYAFYEKGLVECPATSIDHIIRSFSITMCRSVAVLLLFPGERLCKQLPRHAAAQNENARLFDV